MYGSFFTACSYILLSSNKMWCLPLLCILAAACREHLVFETIPPD